MKKRLVFIAVILVLSSLALSACSGNDDSPKTAENKTAPAQTTETSKAPLKEVKISATVPEGWEPVQGSVLQVQYMKSTASFMIKKEAYFKATDLNGVVDEAKAIFQKSFNNVQYQGETGTIQVDGKEAKKFTFTCEVSKMKMKYLYVYLFVGKDVYAITLGDLADSFDSHAADYEKILGQIKFE